MSQDTSTTRTTPTEEAPPHRLALPVMLAGMFLTILDFSIVNVAIPSIQSDLGASSAQIQLVVAGYSLTYGAGLVTGGRLGDRYGRRRMYLIGMVLFVLTSAFCGIAPNAVSLVVGRLLQGAAAAVLFPQVLSLLNVTYTGAARARAFTWYGAVLGTAWVGGQILGGVLIKADVFGLDWRACFLINLPVGLLTLLLAPAAVPESRSATTSRLSPASVLLLTAGLMLLVFPLVEGRQAGWPAWAFVSLAVSVLVLWLFFRYQNRLAGGDASPLIEPALLRSRPFLAGIGTVFATYASMASFFLVFAIYLQEGERYDALGSGLAFLPLGIGFFVTSLLGPRLVRLLGDRGISLGALLLAASEVVLAVVVVARGAAVHAPSLAAPLAATGIGMGLVLTPLISRSLAGVDPDHAGSASGMLSTTQQVGNSLGVALIGVIFYGVLSGTGEQGVRYAHAFGWSMAYTVGLAVVVALLALALPRTRSS